MAANVNNGVPLTAAPSTWSLGGLYFDAWLRLSHNSALTITQHPVETGAAISDHSYANPRRFSFEIGMTDVIASPTLEGGSNSRSINAYNALVKLQQERTPLTLVSKYGSFSNILIESIDVQDDYRTQTSMRATVTLQQIIMASGETFKFSANPQATDTTKSGDVQGPLIELVAPAIGQAWNAGLGAVSKTFGAAVKSVKGWLGQ